MGCQRRMPWQPRTIRDEFDELTKLTLVETQKTRGAEKLGRREWSASFSAQKQDHIRNTTTVRFEFGDAMEGKTRGTTGEAVENFHKLFHQSGSGNFIVWKREKRIKNLKRLKDDALIMK